VKYYTNKARQAGMTLIELVVVLLILVGLSGLLIPSVQGFLSKTHDSTAVDSLKEVDKQILAYSAMYSGHPDNMDSLIEDTADGVIDYAMNAALFTPYTLAGAMNADAVQLENMGIKNVMTMQAAPGDGNYTFAATNVSEPIATGSVLASIDMTKLSSTTSTCTDVVFADAAAPTTAESDLCLESLLGRSAGSIDSANMTYLAFGVGNDASLIGKTMHEAPIHFAKEGGMNAGSKYNRIIAIYEIKTADMSGHMMAKYLGTMMPMMKLEGYASAIKNAYAPG